MYNNMLLCQVSPVGCRNIFQTKKEKQLPAFPITPSKKAHPSIARSQTARSRDSKSHAISAHAPYDRTDSRNMRNFYVLFILMQWHSDPTTCDTLWVVRWSRNLQLMKFAIRTLPGTELFLAFQHLSTKYTMNTSTEAHKFHCCEKKKEILFTALHVFGIENKLHIYTMCAIVESPSCQWYDVISSQNSFHSHRLVPKHLNADNVHQYIYALGDYRQGRERESKRRTIE